MFAKLNKIVLPMKEEKKGKVRVFAQRCQCRTTFKRKDC